MFSFAGDTVLDPFAGSGTTAASAIAHSRQSISVEIVPAYIETMQRRLGRIAGDAQLYSGEMFPYERRAVPA